MYFFKKKWIQFFCITRILDKFNDLKHTENTQFRLGDFTFAVFFLILDFTWQVSTTNV